MIPPFDGFLDHPPEEMMVQADRHGADVTRGGGAVHRTQRNMVNTEHRT